MPNSWILCPLWTRFFSGVLCSGIPRPCCSSSPIECIPPFLCWTRWTDSRLCIDRKETPVISYTSKLLFSRSLISSFLSCTHPWDSAIFFGIPRLQQSEKKKQKQLTRTIKIENPYQIDDDPESRNLISISSDLLIRIIHSNPVNRSAYNLICLEI